MVKIKSQDLQDLVRDIFVAAGCSTEEGGRVGKYLVGANLADTTATASRGCCVMCR